MVHVAGLGAHALHWDPLVVIHGTGRPKPNGHHRAANEIGRIRDGSCQTPSTQNHHPAVAGGPFHRAVADNRRQIDNRCGHNDGQGARGNVLQKENAPLIERPGPDRFPVTRHYAAQLLPLRRER